MGRGHGDRRRAPRSKWARAPWRTSAAGCGPRPCQGPTGSSPNSPPRRDRHAIARHCPGGCGSHLGGQGVAYELERSVWPGRPRWGWRSLLGWPPAKRGPCRRCSSRVPCGDWCGRRARRYRNCRSSAPSGRKPHVGPKAAGSCGYAPDLFQQTLGQVDVLASDGRPAERRGDPGGLVGHRHSDLGFGYDPAQSGADGVTVAVGHYDARLHWTKAPRREGTQWPPPAGPRRWRPRAHPR